MRKRLMVVGGTMVLLGAIPLAVLAMTGSEAGKLDTQGALWTTSSASTTSTAWQDIPDLSNFIFCAKFEVSATLSVNVTGAPVGLRVVYDGGATMQPGPAYFQPSGKSTSFSYTWVINAGTFEGSDGHALTVQWRSLTGATATLTRGVLNVLFQNGSACGP